MDEEAGFNELSPDVQVQVLKFLPFRTRVRFERVCKNWAALLDYVWKRQKRLAVCFANRYDLDPCHDPSHRFALSDVVVDSNHSFIHYQRDSFSVLKRCPNLIALYFAANQVATDSFGTDLFKYCPRLEHVSLRDTTSFIAFSSYVHSKRANYIRCLHIDNDDQDADDDFDECLIEFIKRCPKLESLTNFTNYNTILLMEAAAPKLTELKMGAVDDVAVSFLVAGACQLQRLSVKESLDAESVRQILTLKHLEDLELCASSSAVRLITDSSLRFKSISLLSAEVDGFDAAGVRALLSRHGSYLKRLQVSGIKLVANDFSMFSQCVQLLSLRVLPSDPVTLTNASMQTLSQLRNLKELELAACIMSQNQVDLLLNSLVHLNEISLINVPMVSQIRNSLIAYAQRYPHRQMTAWLAYDDRPNASPPRRRPEGRESRVTRPPPGLSNIDVRGNLRIVYTH